MMGSWPGLFLDESLLFVSSHREELYIEIISFPTKNKRVFVFVRGLRFRRGLHFHRGLHFRRGSSFS